MAMLPFITRRVGDPDYWWHVRTGQWIAQHKALVRADLYTYTVGGTPWTDHEYGSQVIFYALRRAGGLSLISVAFALLVLAGFVFVLARIRERDHAPWVVAAALVLGAAAGFPVWGPRPQMFDFTFIALEVFWIERFLNRGSRAVYYTPLLVLFWANVHGGFVFAFFVLGIAVVALLIRWLWLGRSGTDGARAGRLALVGAASAVASLATPWGPSLFVYVWRTQFSSQLSGFVREWQSPDFHMAAMLPFLALLVLAFTGLAWRRPRLLDVLLLVGTAVVSLRALLFIPVFVAVAVPVVAWQWSAAWGELRRRLPRASLLAPARSTTLALSALAVVSAVAVGIAALTLRGQTAATAANYPVAAADWLAAHPGVGTRMFNEYSWGGYLAYRFFPQPARRVFIYGESELMGDSLLAQYADINNLRSDWRSLLDRFHVDYVVFPTGTPLASALDATSGWHRAYADSLAVIFVRSGAQPS
jgi:hypothetical protein